MEDIIKILEKQKSFFRTGKTRDLHFRQEALRKLEQVILEAEQEMLEALAQDLGKPEFEGYSTDIGPILGDIKYMLKNLEELVRPRKVRTPLALAGGSGRILPQPLGVVLIMAPWNYPFQLLFRPLIGAVAAGNCVVLKPSEHAPLCSAVSRRLIEDAFPAEHVALIEGGVEEGAALLEQKFDCIFFTGGTSMGRTVMKAAARHLTPTVLELGGKSPCIVEPDINLKLSARRIAWGKFLNAGQTCVAPDYLLVNTRIKEPLIEEMQHAINIFYGANPQESPDYARIVNDIHFQRLTGLMKDGQIIYGGQTDQESRYIAPTLIEGVDWTDPIMGEEIFGPLLPILEYEDLDETLDMISEQPKPLALYLFTDDQITQKKVVRMTSSGGVCINDTVSHLLPHDLPFGGVGESGKGSYHGDASFHCFSHSRSIFRNSTRFDLKEKYPPYRITLKKLKSLLRFM
ncbi:aldehyde dehydrogenase [hydrocarbon metagenome]|uniref:Aldehyde dehydrogenase n=1 Tax=hydrocarbon metagenome TaxID=938273 RepID=A0A0W8E486_9ZZZZ